MRTNGSAPLLDRATGVALLAAGAANRFGGGKLAADLGGRPLWRWAADSVERAGFATRFLIAAGDFDYHPEGWEVLTNPMPEEGLASSIRIACEAAARCSRLVIALADMPFVEPSHLRRLASIDGVAFTLYPAGRRGVPAGFPQAAFPRLLALRGDGGAAHRDWGPDTEAIAPASPNSLRDIDKPNDLDEARAELARRSGR